MAKRKTHDEEPAGHDVAGEVPTNLETPGEAVEQLRAELDEAVEARRRALADFANYQRRAAESERQAVRTGAAAVVRSLWIEIRWSFYTHSVPFSWIGNGPLPSQFP